MRAVLRGLAVVATAASLVSLAPAAWAGDWGGGGDPAPPATTPPNTTTGPTTGQVSNCSVISSPSYLGLSCGSGGVVIERNVKKILGDDPVPDCWHEPLTQAELDALHYENTPGPDGSTWYWERCVHGINPTTKEVEGEVTVSIVPVAIPNGDPKKTLTRNQIRLVGVFDGGSGGVPDPVVVSSPSARPRVWSWVSFFNEQVFPDADADAEPVVVVKAGNVWLRAAVDSTDVYPLGFQEGTKVSCADDGFIALRGDNPETRPGGCWYRYERSSVDQPGSYNGLPAYPAVITAHWQVSVSADGGATWTPFNAFTKSSDSPVAVTEVQALVVNTEER